MITFSDRLLRIGLYCCVFDTWTNFETYVKHVAPPTVLGAMRFRFSNGIFGHALWCWLMGEMPAGFVAEMK